MSYHQKAIKLLEKLKNVLFLAHLEMWAVTSTTYMHMHVAIYILHLQTHTQHRIQGTLPEMTFVIFSLLQEEKCPQITFSKKLRGQRSSTYIIKRQTYINVNIFPFFLPSFSQELKIRVSEDVCARLYMRNSGLPSFCRLKQPSHALLCKSPATDCHHVNLSLLMR